MNSNQIKAGMLVMRGSLMMLVVEIGECYHEGFALCRGVDPFKGEYWILKSLLTPV